MILPRSPQLCQNGSILGLSSIGETEKGRVGGEDSHVPFWQKFPGKRRNLRRCVVVMQQPALLSPKFGAKFSHIFMQSL
jgi:hypothetical protein